MNPQNTTQPPKVQQKANNNNGFWATKRALLLVGFVLAAFAVQALVRAGGVSFNLQPEQAKHGNAVLVCEDSSAADEGYVQLNPVGNAQDC